MIAEDQRTNPTFTDRQVTVRGLRVQTRRRQGPVGPPLLLVNGLGGSLTSWGPLLEHLPGRDVIMVDTPGSGRSQTPRLPIRVPQLADVVVGAAQELGAEQFDVLGYSLGGTIAQEIAHRHPQQVRRLILVATMFGLGARPVPIRTHRTLLSTKRYHDRAAMEDAMPRLAGGRSARDPKVMAGLLDVRESHPPTKRGYYYQQLSLTAWSSAPWLRRLDVPTLVLHGEGDPVVPQVNARMLAWLLREARLEVVPGAGHLLLFDDAETSGALINEFLTSGTGNRSD